MSGSAMMKKRLTKSNATQSSGNMMKKRLTRVAQSVPSTASSFSGNMTKKSIQRKPVSPSKGELNRGQGTGNMMMKKTRKKIER